MLELLSKRVPRTKSNSASTIQSAVWNCLSQIKHIFCDAMWQWVQHESTTTYLNQKGCQLSLQQAVKVVLAFRISKSADKVTAFVFWNAHAILFIDYLENHEKATSHAKEQRTVSPGQCTLSQVYENNRGIEWNTLWVASSDTVFSSTGSQQLFTSCRPQTDSPGENIWLKGRSCVWTIARWEDCYSPLTRNFK